VRRTQRAEAQHRPQVGRVTHALLLKQLSQALELKLRKQGVGNEQLLLRFRLRLPHVALQPTSACRTSKHGKQEGRSQQGAAPRAARGQQGLGTTRSPRHTSVLC